MIMQTIELKQELEEQGPNSFSTKSDFRIDDQQDNQNTNSVRNSTGEICDLIKEDRDTSSADLSNHSNFSPVTSAFACVSGDKQFVRSDDLNEHRLIHIESKKEKCPECGKMFTLKGTLRTHMRIHTGEKPFKCRYCAQTFTRLFDATSHEKRKHENDRKHKCDLCDKGYVTAWELRYHMATHRYCTETFAQLSNAYSHEKIKHEKRKHKCDLCNKGFVTAKDLRNHTATH